MFKEKSSKKRIVTSQNSKEASTLDAKHQNMILQLSERREQLKQMIDEREYLLQQVRQYEDMIQDMKGACLIDTEDYDVAWSSNIFMRERVRILDKSIHYLRDSRDEVEYYEDTAKILFQYYDLLENQVTYTNTQSISLAPVRATKGRKKLLPVSSRSILEALHITPSEAKDEDDVFSPGPSPSMPPPVTTQGLDKSSLVDEYLAAVDSSYVRKKNYEHLGICEECQLPLICLQQDGIMVCSQCGYQELLLVEQNRPILRQPSKEASHFSYKRINHFNSLEWNSRHEMCATC
jgi:hypothetical protein